MPLSGSKRAPLAAALLLILGAGLSACEPTCKATCRKLLACDDVNSPRVSQDDCEYSCTTQQNLYEQDWEDTQLREALADAKRCVSASSCEDIAAGVCYDEDLYIW